MAKLWRVGEQWHVSDGRWKTILVRPLAKVGSTFDWTSGITADGRQITNIPDYYVPSRGAQDVCVNAKVKMTEHDPSINIPAKSPTNFTFKDLRKRGNNVENRIQFPTKFLKDSKIQRL
ncbi:hypothetical protein HPP92_011804 [Vanilla planifolia]|uniref:Uncharacterized protein n=1 Tax=Vanilla planifolia TaxID=51239 RepID=A0A835R1C4_VANPL|nr:hypothetical protein HPP92_011804 [Vanilla planifolia]